ncbi:site-specific integrase [Paenibacillus silvae]|uniref:site-specific integrase n=1 Tax=Paenibacillus silvae TaxID=1325358 RepID=UPI003CEE55D5
MLFEDVYKEFLFDLEIKNYSILTIKGYRNNNRAFLNYLCNEFSVVEVEEINTSHIKAYLMNLKMKGLSESCINGIQKIFVHSLTSLCRKGILLKSEIQY